MKKKSRKKHKLDNRPSWDEMHLIKTIFNAARSTCVIRQVGAEIVAPSVVDSIQSGYNGTPEGVPNCNEGVCIRCSSDLGPGVSPELCICQHAERNAYGRAARRGIPTEGSTLYVSARPCGLCLKEAITHGTARVVYLDRPGGYPADESFKQFARMGRIKAEEYKGPMKAIESARKMVKELYGREI